MSPPTSGAFSLKLTRNWVLTGAVIVLIGLTTFLAVRYVDAYIPKLIESEVAKQFKSEVKGQIAEEIKINTAGQIQTTRDELLKIIQKNNESLNGQIIDIYKTVSGRAETLAPALKRGTKKKKNHASLMRTVPVSRELLEHAIAKALSEPTEAPILSQLDISQITRSLFTRYNDSSLNQELWETLLELASYKTVITGIRYGANQFSRNPDDVVSLNDSEFKNKTIVGKVIVLGQCGVRLRNVRFLNCRFEVERGTNGESLLRTLLESDRSSISIRLESPPGYVKGACDK
jgi:hypothetical protein